MGEDVESILHKLYMESGQDIERCQRGIVYLDEIDKVGVGIGIGVGLVVTILVESTTKTYAAECCLLST